MKKILLTFTLVLAGLSITLAQQQISFSHEGTALGDTVTVWIDPNETTFHEYKISVHNNTDNGMNIKIAREIISSLGTDQFSFCWGSSCYPPAVDTSGNYQFIAAGSQTSEEENLSADYFDQDLIGYTMVKYTAYNMNSPEIAGSIVVRYWVSPTSVEEDILKDGFISEIYPNPATSFVKIDYRLTSQVNSAQVKVFNLLGSSVKETEMTFGGSSVKFDVSDLENGIYFYSVLLNGDVYTTKKLIIRK